MTMPGGTRCGVAHPAGHVTALRLSARRRVRNSNFRPAEPGRQREPEPFLKRSSKRRQECGTTPVAYRQGRRPDATGRSTGSGLRWSHMTAPHSPPIASRLPPSAGNLAPVPSPIRHGRPFHCRLPGSVVGNPADCVTHGLRLPFVTVSSPRKLSRAFGSGSFPLAVDRFQQLSRKLAYHSHEVLSPTPQASEKDFPLCRKLRTPNRTSLPGIPESPNPRHSA